MLPAPLLPAVRLHSPLDLGVAAGGTGRRRWNTRRGSGRPVQAARQTALGCALKLWAVEAQGSDAESVRSARGERASSRLPRALGEGAFRLSWIWIILD